MESDALKVKLSVFEGPLDLLLHLIKKNKLDIYDIPILEITRQYLAYLKSWDDMNIEVASEFIVMAATLINIKARHLLPSAQQEEEEETDEEAELIRRLILYKQFKEAAEGLKKLERPKERTIFLRKSETIRGERPLPSVKQLLEGVELEELKVLCERLLISKRESYDDIRASFKAVPKDNYRVADKIRSLQDALEMFDKVSFYELREKSHSKEEEVTFFMAMLELSRMNEVVLDQQKLFGDITVTNKSEEDKAYGETLPETGDE